MVSKSKKGNYYKKKVKDWLILHGYNAEYAEKYTRYWNSKTNSVGHIKTDLFASDIIAINKECVAFINVISNRVDIGNHVKRYKKIVFPNSSAIKIWVVLWESRADGPEFIDVKDYQETLNLTITTKGAD